MAFYSDSSVPTLWIDEARCRTNIERMASRARNSGVMFRPHFKTHQSGLIGNWFRDYDVRAVAVSSVSMAAYFIKAGWDDLTIAFPFNVREVRQLDELASKAKIAILAESPEVIRSVNKALTHPVDVWLKIDIGSDRAGIMPSDVPALEQCINALNRSQYLNWRGFLAHAGHTYHCRDSACVESIYSTSIEILQELKSNYTSKEHNSISISYGDTPSCSIIDDLSECDEIRPGNFVFYDLMQWQIGACTIDDIAVLMTCPVVAVHRERNKAIIYGGAIHFGRDHLEMSGSKIFGTQVALSGQNWSTEYPSVVIERVSQEHGVVRWNEGEEFGCHPGDVAGFLPVHSCMTAQYMGRYRLLSGREADHFAQTRHQFLLS